MTSNTYVNEESLQQFTSILANKIHHGFTIIEKNDSLPLQFYLKGKEVDHGLNFLLCCMTLGVWSVGWIYVTYVSSKEKHCNCH
jgi:hypothetical protein